MNVRESDEVNRKVREVLKTLDVTWRNGGEMLTVANKIVSIVGGAFDKERDYKKELILLIHEMTGEYP